MKHLATSLVTILAVLGGTGVSPVLAVSMSSSKIDTFMTLPGWMPTSVDAEHTFGSADHSNASHRVTADTLAAVESIFDAYHERVFYASDSFAPVWDRAVYGPKPADGLQTLWFTNTLASFPGCFVYSSWTNTWPRATPESRRLLEFTNAFSLARLTPPANWIPMLFDMRRGAPWLDKGETWGTNRTVMFASSWGPAEKSVPDDVPWTEGRPLEPGEVDFDSMAPLCYCSNDSVFVTKDFPGRKYGFVYKVLSDVDRTFNVLGYGVTNAAGETVKRGGILGEWDTVGFSNSLIRATTVPCVITNRFPLADPEYAMTNFTRRLVPDDYRVYDVTSYWDKVDEVLVEGISLEAARPGGTIVTDASFDPATVYYQALAAYDFDSELNVLRSTSWTVYSSEPPGYPQETLSAVADIQVFPTESKFDRVTVRVEYGPIGAWYRDLEHERTEDLVWWWHQDGALVFEGWKFVTKTNSVTAASSLTATESRALAMLDRTYETGPHLVTNGPRKAELTRYRADASHEGEVRVTVSTFDNFPFVDIAPITLDDITTGEPVYQTSNSVVDVVEDDPFSREFARFSGETASGALAVLPATNLLRHSITAGDVLTELEKAGGLPPVAGSYPVQWVEPVTVSGSGEHLYTSMMCDLGVTWFFFFYDAGPSLKSRFRLPTRYLVSRSAWLAVGDRIPRTVYENSSSHVAPGPQGFGDNRVAKCVVELFSGILSMRSHVDPYGGQLDSLWFPNMFATSLPADRPYDDEDLDDHPPVPYVFEPSFSIRGEEVGSNGAIPGKVYAARDDVRSRAILDLTRMVVGPGGSMSSARDVIPVHPLGKVFSPLLIDRVTLGVELRKIDVSIVRRDYESGPEVIENSTGRVMAPGEQVAWLLFGAEAMYRARPEIDRSKLHPAVAVDGRVEPVVVTDWNWKALKTERSNQ